MAGLLDNDVARFLLTGPRRYYEYKDQQAAQQQFQGLLGGLQQQGPVQPGQGLLGSRPPDQSFWLKAAAIPGYGGLAGTMLATDAQQTGALTRQRDEQQFALHNVTKDQSIDNALAEQRFGWDRQMDEAGYNLNAAKARASIGASNASAANSYASRDLSRARLQEQNRTNQAGQMPLYYQLNAPDRLKANDALTLADSRATGSMNVVDWVENRASGSHLRGVGQGFGPAMEAEWMLSVLPAIKDMMGAGALDNSEREFMQQLIGNPSDMLATPGAINKLKVISQKVQDERVRQYRNYELDAPQLGGKNGAPGRSLSNERPNGAVRDVQSIQAPTIWNKVQR